MQSGRGPLDSGKWGPLLALKETKTGQSLTLDAQEFIRRFLLHILPDGFMLVRHFGFLANRPKKRPPSMPQTVGTQSGLA